MLNLDLSIVVPIDLHRRTRDIYKRIKHYVHIFSDSNIKVIFGCNSEPRYWVNKVKNLIALHANFQLCLVNADASSLAKLRNTALDAVKTEFVLFLDIDIWPDLNIIHQAYEQVINHPSKLGMFPCLYLSKNGSKKIGKWSTSEFIHSYYDFRRDLIQHLAFPSSILLTDMASVKYIMGFDEDYVGHGYEDFDFMLRLFQHKKLIEYTQDILIDEPYLAPLMSTGLRALLAKPYLEILLSPCYFLHVYHAKNKEEHYYQRREVNKNYFKTKFQSQILVNSQMNKLELLQSFFDLFTDAKESPNYAVLWAQIKGYKFRNNSSIISKFI